MCDESTMVSDPQMMATLTAGKGQMMNPAPNVGNIGTVPSELPPNSSTSAMAGQAQSMNPAPIYAMQPGGTVR